MKYANYANYLIKYAFYRETTGLIEFYRKNYIRLNLGTFDTPRHKILTGFPLSTMACTYYPATKCYGSVFSIVAEKFEPFPNNQYFISCCGDLFKSDRTTVNDPV